jgi:ATP-dependent helicase HrpB
MPENLPILDILPDITHQLRNNNTLILQAPPGAGKSTVLPLELLKEPWLKGQKIVMLEPRRLAARSVSTRMASLLEEPVGKTVGYKVRFENKTSPETRLEVLTEGILTRLLQEDNALEGVGLVIFDEFHERSLHADLALALCREVQQVLREDLKILIMSATLDGESLSSLLGNAPIVTSQGRQHPIQYIYLGNEPETPMPQRMATAIKKALKEHEGDILAFFPGAGEIQRTLGLLEESVGGVVIYPLYGDLSMKQQQEAITPHPYGKRKVVLATSIAETSLTIEGVKIVVDSGLARVPNFDPRTGLTRLVTTQVTQDAADQRAGRAGRLGTGVSYRLWSEASQLQLIAHRKPEILEADLAPTVLELSQWGIQDLRSLTWLTPPPVGAISQSKELLHQLEALEENKITDRGKNILRLPTHPRIAHLLLEGKAWGLTALATDVAALLEERDPLPKESGANLGLRIEVLRKWRNKEYVSAERSVLERIERLAQAWRKSFGIEADNSFPNYEHIGRLLAAAYPERIARQRDNDRLRYRLSNGRIVKLQQDHDELDREKWLVVAHLDAGATEGKIFLASPVNPDELSHLFQKKETVRWDSQKGILLAQMELRLGDIIVKTTPLERISDELRVQLLCDTLRSEGLGMLNWTEEVIQWQNRILSLAVWRPEEDLPKVDNAHLLETTETWLGPFLTNVKKKEDFQKLDVMAMLKGLLSWEQANRLDVVAPDKIKVPSSSLIDLQYFPDGSDPVLAVRLQEMFGLLDTPTVNEGRTKVLLHLLSPGYKPVQVTQDLRSFWQNAYPIVRKELRVRYQKHHWPEDPWTAEAVRGAKKRVV